MLILRLVVGLTLAAHGAQKLFGWWEGPGIAGWTAGMERMRMRPPKAWAWISALAEFVGGLLFALGLLTPLGAFAIVGSMLVAIATVHWPNGFWNGKRGYEFNLVILASVIGVALTGPGAYSFDSLLGIRIPEPAAFIVLAIATVGGVAATLASRRPAEPAVNRETA